MKRISEAALKKAILAVEAKRSKHPPAFRPDRQQRATLQKSRREAEKMVAAFLKQAGFDMTKFQALQEQRGAELERMVAKHKADALQLASQQKDTLRSSIVAQSKALRELASRDDFFPYPSFSLPEPFLIGAIPPMAVTDSAAVPFGSWAKFKFSTSSDGTQKVGFYFVWTTPFRDYAVINAVTSMSATGHLKSHAPWGFSTNTSWVIASALFNLWLGPPPPDAVTSTNYAREFLGQTGAFGSPWTGPDTEGTSISSGLNLIATMFAVPPNNVVVFEVALELDYDNNSGDIEADFESGDFQIACPIVVFELLNRPPR